MAHVEAAHCRGQAATCRDCAAVVTVVLRGLLRGNFFLASPISLTHTGFRDPSCPKLIFKSTFFQVHFFDPPRWRLPIRTMACTIQAKIPFLRRMTHGPPSAPAGLAQARAAVAQYC